MEHQHEIDFRDGDRDRDASQISAISCEKTVKLEVNMLDANVAQMADLGNDQLENCDPIKQQEETTPTDLKPPVSVKQELNSPKSEQRAALKRWLSDYASTSRQAVTQQTNADVDVKSFGLKRVKKEESVDGQKSIRLGSNKVTNQISLDVKPEVKKEVDLRVEFNSGVKTEARKEPVVAVKTEAKSIINIMKEFKNEQIQPRTASADFKHNSSQDGPSVLSNCGGNMPVLNVPKPFRSDKPFPCNHPGCKTSFAQRISLDVHKRIHLFGKPFPCNQPGYEISFAQRNNLDIPKRIHLGEKPFRCYHPACGKSFSRRGHLDDHKLNHLGDKLFPYNYPGHEKLFDQRINLVGVQKQVHTGDKPFRCDHPGCEQSFPQRINLNVHKRIHLFDKPFPCNHPGCGKSFTRRDYLDDHKRNHLDQKPCRCNHAGCEKSFARRRH